MRFEQNDQWTGTYMKAGAVSIVADCKKINTETNFITLGNVSLDQPSFVMKVIPALQPSNSKELANKPVSASTSPLNINADEITINKGSLLLTVILKNRIQILMERILILIASTLL